MRTPSDMPAPAATSGSTSHRGRRWIILAAVILVVLVLSLHTFAVFYTDALWFSSVNLHSVWLKLFEVKAGLMLVFSAIFRGRVRQAVPGGHRALLAVAAGGRRGGAVAHRRLPGPRSMAELAALPEQHTVQRHRSAVPQERRLLRLHPSVPAIRDPLDPGGVHRRATGHHAQPLPERRHPDAGSEAPGPAGGQGAPVGHPGPDRPHQGGRLLPGPVQPRPLLQRLRPGGGLHRRTRPTSRPRAPHPGVAGRRRTADLQHPPTGLGPPHPGRRPVVPRRADRRNDLPRGRAGTQGESGAEHPRTSLHPAQHRRHPHGLRPQQGGQHELPGVEQPVGDRGLGQQ